MASKKKKAKLRKERVPMVEQAPEARVENFLEVPQGYTPDEAQSEADRCIQCPKPTCVVGCPVGVDIPKFLLLISERKFAEAAQQVKVDNCLPGATGRVCPQENQCEGKCVLGKKFDAVGIGRLERFTADYAREQNLEEPPPMRPSSGRKVAIVGSGPAGLSAAGELAQLGHQAVIFEAFHRPGGVLMYGIPEFRLPKKLVEHEVDQLAKLGVTIEYNQVIGKTITLEELLEEEGFDAIFIGVGAGLPKFMGVPGENLGGIYAANEYLTRANLMKAYDFPSYDTPMAEGKRVCVVGGGNVAMDAARTARRLGSDVTVIYRRSRDELPARSEEIHHAEQEGIHFEMLATPVNYIGNEEGRVEKVVCQRMALGEPDSSGRRRPSPVAGSDYEIPADLIIVAIGSGANPLLTTVSPQLSTNEWGNLVADDNGRTPAGNIWAGGDIVTGAATVILAMGAGKRAAQDIDRYLREELGPKENN